MMALSGVRISWLTLARKSDLADEARLGLALGLGELLLGLLPLRDVAEHGAELRCRRPIRPIVMNSGMRPPSRTRPITSRPSLSTLATPARISPSR